MLLGKSSNDSSSQSPLTTTLGFLLPPWPPVLLTAAWTWWTHSHQGPLHQPTPLWMLLTYPPGAGLTAFNLSSAACPHPVANCPLNTPDWACPSPIVVQLLMWPHELWDSRLLCRPLSPRVCANSCPSSWWCISSPAASFSFCLQSFPTSGSFPGSRLFSTFPLYATLITF